MELISPTEIAKEKIEAVQDYSVLAGRSVSNLFRYPRYFADMMQQADLIGVGSLPIVILTGLSIGAELALNSANTLQRFGSLSLIGQLVSVGMVRELGPIITGLMVAGRNSSGMASELGSMVVTEQIDAMRALGTDPMKKLVTPRVISTVFMLFFLTIISDLLGLFGGSSDFHFVVQSRLAAVLEQRLPDSDVPGCAHGPAEAGSLRIHYCHRRVLLRSFGTGWDTGRGPGNHTSGRCVVGFDPYGGPADHQVPDGNFFLSLSHGRASDHN